MKLARELGFSSSSEMLETITYEELCEHIAYHEIYPFSEDRADIRSALQTYFIVCALINPKDASKLKPEQFLPKYERKQPMKQTWQQQLAMMKAYTAALSSG